MLVGQHLADRPFGEKRTRVEDVETGDHRGDHLQVVFDEEHGHSVLGGERAQQGGQGHALGPIES